MTFKDTLFGGAALAVLASTAPAAMAQDTDAVQAGDEAIDTAERIVVIGAIPFRNRSEETEPVLEYDSEYFQRFEPLTAGDALRRVPSVTFLSDVIESDGARLRGLAPGYTQVLIDGERVPGSEADRSFFLDRIPAELIERVEIVRSSSASRTGDAVAGALNIVLRDGYDLDGGYVRAGALRFDDGEFKPSLGLVWGGDFAGGRLLTGFNLQGRYNPKQKTSLRYGDSPENDPDYATNEFDNREDQSDIRDGTDYSFNSRYTLEFADGSELELGGFATFTDRTEDERSWEFDAPAGGELLTDNHQFETIEQLSYSLEASYERPFLGGELDLKLGYATFDEDVDVAEDELNLEDNEFEGALERIDITDNELSFRADQTFEFGNGMEFEFGLFWQNKERDTNILEGEIEEDYDASGWDRFAHNPSDLRTATPDFEPADGGIASIEETRFDVFALVGGETDRIQWEAGLRYETTDVSIFDATVDPANRNHDNDYGFLLPSAHIRFELSEVDRVTLSAARTVRRPRFDYISPVLLEEEVGEDDLLGNPQLEPETAWGFDAGYERRIAGSGIVGVNVFYRDVTDLVELANTGEEGSEGPGTFILQPRNTGDGQVWGIEFDLSTPLTFLGLENTGIFANYSWLDSEIEDFMGTRRFNGQSDYVFNVGFIHSIPSWNSAFGVTYREQGDAYDRLEAEEVYTAYGADLEVFLERSFYDNITIRFVGSNLLNASKDEIFNKFDNVEEQIERDFDEYELETEEAGPVFQLMARVAF